MGKGRQDANQSPTKRRLSVQQAAGELDISAEAVRIRIKRGTLESVKECSTVYVLLTDRTADQTALLTHLEAEISYLREQLDAERRANEENRRIIAGLTSRIPQLEAPQQGQDQPQEPAEEPGSVEDRGEPEKRSWWRRWFGS